LPQLEFIKLQAILLYKNMRYRRLLDLQGDATSTNLPKKRQLIV
jgi:hypothetical protein